MWEKPPTQPVTDKPRTQTTAAFEMHAYDRRRFSADDIHAVAPIVSRTSRYEASTQDGAHDNSVLHRHLRAKTK